MLAIGLTALVVTWRAPSYAQHRSEVIQHSGVMLLLNLGVL